MSKFVFLLCAFLLAGTVRAENTKSDENTSLVEHIKNKIVANVNLSIKQVTNYFQNAEEAMTKTMKSLEDDASKVRISVSDKIVEVQKKLSDEFQKVLMETLKYDLSDCKKINASLVDIIAKATTEVKNCTTGIMKSANNNLENMKQFSEVVMKNLIDIKAEAEKCVKDVHDFWSGAKAFNCVSKAASKGTWEATKNVPGLLLKLGKLTWQVKSLLPELTNCATTVGVEKFNKGSKIVVEKVRECIEAIKQQPEPLPTPVS